MIYIIRNIVRRCFVEKKIKVTQIGAGSLGRLIGTVNALFALAAGLVGSIIAVADVVAMNDYSLLMNIGVSTAIVLGGILVLPMLAFVFGWFYGALVGFIWNAFLSASGGIEMTVNEVAEPSKK